MCSSRRLLFAFVLVLSQPLAAQIPRDSQRNIHAEVSGIALLNAYYNDDLVNNRSVPWLASPRHPFIGEPLEALGSTVRQSRVLLSAWASDVLGGCAEGELDLDFFGTNSAPGRREPTPRIRRAVGRISWPGAWLLFGQEALLISPLNPSSFSAVAVPGFTGSGNLSRWMPQVRLGMEMGTAIRVGIEAAAVAPRFDSMLDEGTTEPDRAELSKRPFVQGRVLTKWGTNGTEGEIGVGGHYGWFMNGPDTLGVTRAGAVSARFLFSDLVEFRGEAFLGEGLAMLGGGGINQTLSPDGNPVRTRGGWGQLNLHPTPILEVGGGYGFDDPDDADLDAATGLSFNVRWEVHCHLRAAPLVVALEYRRLETTYADAIYDLQTANHLNLALGFEF